MSFQLLEFLHSHQGIIYYTLMTQTVKNLSACSARDLDFIPGEGISPLEEGMATHPSILALRIPMDRGGWRATVHGVAKSWTRLRDYHFYFLFWNDLLPWKSVWGLIKEYMTENYFLVFVPVFPLALRSCWCFMIKSSYAVTPLTCLVEGEGFQVLWWGVSWMSTRVWSVGCTCWHEAWSKGEGGRGNTL